MDAPIPDRVKFRLAHKRGDRIYWKQYERELIVDGKNVWLQHPQRGQDFDIAALEIQDVDLESVIWISKDAVWDPIKMRASADVFIVGYPEKTPSQENLPIWKRGTIASEPQHWSKNLPIILVDTLGRPGLSGSPVYIRTAGVYEEERSGDLTAGDPTATRFVGIYSGRFGVSQTEDFQLGCVWYDYLIDEVVSGNSIGKSTQRTFEEFMSHSSEKAPKPNYEK